MKKGIRIQFCIALFCTMLVSFSVFAQSSGNVKIGNQIWMSKNLDMSTFRNGEAIPEAKDAEQWIKAGKNKKAAFCYYEYDSKNGKVYGKLYNWYAVNDPRGLAPKDYHVPSDAEWTVLTDFLGGETVAGKKMKSTSGWANPYRRKDGDNSSGFNGLPGGDCNWKGDFEDITEAGQFWSSSEISADYAWYRYLYYDHMGVGRDHPSKLQCFSVRCIKD